MMILTVTFYERTEYFRHVTEVRQNSRELSVYTADGAEYHYMAGTYTTLSVLETEGKCYGEMG